MIVVKLAVSDILILVKRYFFVILSAKIAIFIEKTGSCQPKHLRVWFASSNGHKWFSDYCLQILQPLSDDTFHPAFW